MMIRETSIETFLQIKREGLLSKRRQEVYECLYNHGPLTANEVFTRLNLPTNQSGRFTELEKLGVIKEQSVRVCRVTGRRATAWITTNGLPKEPEKASFKITASNAERLGFTFYPHAGSFEKELKDGLWISYAAEEFWIHSHGHEYDVSITSEADLLRFEKYFKC